MRAVCSWCRRLLPDREPFDSNEITHGICSTCVVEVERHLGDVPREALLRGEAEPTMLLTRDLRLVSMNDAMSSVLGKSEAELRGLLGGEVFACETALAQSDDACGSFTACGVCELRQRVMQSYDTGDCFTGIEANLPSKSGARTLHFSTSRHALGVVLQLIRDDRVTEDPEA